MSDVELVIFDTVDAYVEAYYKDFIELAFPGLSAGVNNFLMNWGQCYD
jgi:hypothetical protein